MTDDQAAPRTLAERLDWLFDKVRPTVWDDGKRLPYSKTRQHHNSELARHLGVSASYVGQLRNGKTGNPTADVLRGIAAFFDGPASYLLSDAAEAARVEAEILYKVALRRFEDGELSAPPADPTSSSWPRQVADEMPDSSRPVCEKLNWLFENTPSKHDHRPYTEEEVAEAIREKAFVVRGLRTGDITDCDVSVPVLRKLAAFFGQRLSYLYDDAIDDDHELLDLVREAKKDERGLLGVLLRRSEIGDDHRSGLISGLKNPTSARVLLNLIRNHFTMDDELRRNSASGANETGS